MLALYMIQNGMLHLMLWNDNLCLKERSLIEFHIPKRRADQIILEFIIDISCRITINRALLTN